jgi:biotin transport system substrate-specific component
MSHRQTQTRNLILAGLFSALMIVGANLRIPFPWVPLTFQPFFAILSGLLLGASVGMVSQGAYLLLVWPDCRFSPMAQPVCCMSTRPTFGFLIGFVLASGVAGC